MTEFAGKVYRPPEKMMEEDPLGRKVLVVKKPLTVFPEQTTRDLNRVCMTPDSGQHLVVKPTGPEEAEKGRERVESVRENYPCG